MTKEPDRKRMRCSSLSSSTDVVVSGELGEENQQERDISNNRDNASIINGSENAPGSANGSGDRDSSSNALAQELKEREEINARKKSINLASKEFQESLEKIILNLGQQNGRNLPKPKLCMLQLCILMHSAQCKRPVSCLVPQCEVIKGVLGHMSICRDIKCKVMHCIPSKQLIRHWNVCRLPRCDPCKTILDTFRFSSSSENENRIIVCSDKNKPRSIESQLSIERGKSPSTNQPRDAAMETRLCSVDGTTVAPSDASDNVDVIDAGSHLPSALTLSDNGCTGTLKATAKQPLLGKHVWSPSEFVGYLKPVLEKLWNLGIASRPFHHPVSPELDACPDYFKIITRPMDLGTIRRKLNEGLYRNPWGFIDDIYQMFRNAWSYNHYTSKYYKYATKLALAFEDQIDSIMQSLGYCCGRQYSFNPPVIECNTVNACAIKPYAVYYTSPSGYIVCEDCYMNNTGMIAVYDENTQRNLLIQKLALSKKRNAELPPEEIVSCTKCGRAFHSICVLYSPELWPYGYVCKICVLFYGIKYARNHFTAKSIPETALSQHLEQRIGRYFAKRNIPNPNVCIRVLASCQQETHVLPKFKQHFPESPDTISYTSKGIYAFQEQDGEDVCFFSLYVQEYGSEVSGPNSRCVYLAYLDSVNLFKPSNCRTGLYSDIIHGYMEFVKKSGFQRMFIWSCPPSAGDDYIFYCHPESQKTPKPRRLHDWYTAILDKSVLEGIVESYKDMFIFALEQNFKSPTEVPYFSGDYWPTAIEELLAVLDKQTTCEKTSEGITVSQQTEKPKKKRGKKLKGAKTKKTTTVALTGNEAVMEKLFDSFKKNRGMFFVVEFNSSDKVSSLPPTVDVDKLNPNELVNNRTSFLIYARSYRLEFSSLRRAKFSTQAALVEYDRCNSLGVVCDNCGISVGNANGLLACRACKNFQLCLVCYEELGHEHQLHQTWNSKELCDRISDLQCLKDDLKHAASCTRASCPERNCLQLKNAVEHIRGCLHKKTCKKCRCIFVIVCMHARSCDDQNCSIVLCNEVKCKQNEKRRAQKENDARIMRRRMHVMAAEESSEELAPTSQSKLTDASNTSLNRNSSARGKGSRPASSLGARPSVGPRHLNAAPRR